jgi:PD-(D/E)XK nuclease superfamily
MTDKPAIRVRASGLAEYLDCSRRAAARSFRQSVEERGFTLRKLENNIAAAIGTATHEGATWSLAEQIKTGKLGDQVEAEHRSLESLKREREMGVTYDNTSPDPNTAEKQVVRQLRTFRVYIAPAIVPTAVERRLEGQVAEGMILTGQSDIAESISTGGIGIRDLKTGVKEKYHGAQLGAYSLLGRAHGEDVREMKVDFIQRVPIRNEQPEPQLISYDVAETEQLTWATLKRIKRDHDEFHETGDLNIFLPNPGSMLCSAKYCPAHGTRFCVHHAKKETSE